MEHFADKLIDKISEVSNPMLVELNPVLEDIPNFIKTASIKKYGESLEAVSTSIIAFNIGIIDAISGIVPIVKLKISFYEHYGHAGFFAYEETIKYAKKKGLMVISDINTSTLGLSAEICANTFLGKTDLFGKDINIINADALTLNPYLGSDSIKPFLNICKKEGKGLFVLVKSSNESADEIQGLVVGDHLLDEEVSTLLEGWGRDLIGESGFSSVAAIIDSVYPEETKSFRNLMPNQIFLISNYNRKDKVSVENLKSAFYENATGAILSDTNKIAYAYKSNNQFKEENYAEISRKFALLMKRDLEEILIK